MKINSVSRADIIRSALDGNNKEFYMVVRDFYANGYESIREQIEGIEPDNFVTHIRTKPVRSMTIADLMAVEDNNNVCFIEIED